MPYLDHASATPIHPAAIAAMQRVGFADPTRLYSQARSSRKQLDAARAKLAESIGARPNEIIFTSGGTEANHLAVQGGVEAAAAARRPPKILASAIEQRSILDQLPALELGGTQATKISTNFAGVIELAELEEALAGGASLVCVQMANGEIGTAQPLEQVAKICQAAGSWLHVDATFAASWLPLNVKELGADMVSFSGRHFGGPPGTGALWVKSGVRVRPRLVGDDREGKRRAGMQNLAGIVGMAEALDARINSLAKDSRAMFISTAGLRSSISAAVPDAIVHGHETLRVPHIVSFTVPMVEGDALLMGLDAKGISVHSGSACASDTGLPSHVLAAIGTFTHGAIRVSIAPTTTRQELEDFAQALPHVVESAKAKLKR